MATQEEPEEEPAQPQERWPAGAATAIGSLPGTDPREAAATVVGELPLLPYLPELPARGVGADIVGRTASFLVDIAVEVRPSGYRVTDRPGRDHRRAVDLLRGDLDAFEEACDPVRPEWVKVQAAGPWSLAATVELHTGHRVLTDHGAVREFTASLTEGLRQHVVEVAARTGASVVLQLDEPALPAVIAGTIPTPSGYGTVRAVAETDAQDALRDLVAALGVPVVVHCCADEPPVRLLNGIGAAGISIDATRPAVAGRTAVPAALDALGETWDAGTPLLLGIVPALDPGRPVAAPALATRVFELADRLGFDRHRLTELAVPTPTCGLAGATPSWARQAMALCAELAKAFADPDE
ncbi:methionine synthase [Actinomycetes bacterium KLBMP 9759]